MDQNQQVMRKQRKLKAKAIHYSPARRMGKSGGITPQQLESLKQAVMQSGGVVTFCRENPTFSKDTVFHILQGRRKRMDGVARMLFQHFKLLTREPGLYVIKYGEAWVIAEWDVDFTGHGVWCVIGSEEEPETESIKTVIEIPINMRKMITWLATQ